MTNEHTSLEKYTPHTLSKGLGKGCKRVMCERWVGDGTDCNILTPSYSDYSSTSFSFCSAAQSGVLRAHCPLLGAGSLYSILNPTNWPQLTEPICGSELYNCLTLTCFPRVSQLHGIQPVHGQGCILISSTGCTCFLMDGWVKSQYVTYLTLLFCILSLSFRNNSAILCLFIFIQEQFCYSAFECFY